MNTRKYRILRNRIPSGYVWISDNHPHFPNCKVGTIIPINRQGTWEIGDLEIIFGSHITDIFPLEMVDQTIIIDFGMRAYPNEPITYELVTN